MLTKVKVAVQTENRDTSCWPCINYDFEKELGRVMEPVRRLNPDMEFDTILYTELEQAEADYAEDVKKYDGVLVLLMTCWKQIDAFYCKQAETGLPVIVADVPYCGSGSMLAETSQLIRKEKYPVPLVASLDYNDIARAVKSFEVLKRMKTAKILIISNRVQEELQEETAKIWGCGFINKTSDELLEYFFAVPEEAAAATAERWRREATDVLEPSDADIIESAKLYHAIAQMKADTGADALTVDCLALSYGEAYGSNKHMYPCLSHFEMNNAGEIGVCEADINATISAMLTMYLTGRPGFVSDPVIDTSSDQIIYAHCVACTKVYGKDDPRCCKHYIRSHAEDQLGAAVQVIFPAGEKLTTVMVNGLHKTAAIHSSDSLGNVGGDEGCRSKLSAKTNAENLLMNWMPQWHRVTVFGDYRNGFKNLFRMKGLRISEEDRYQGNF